MVFLLDKLCKKEQSVHVSFSNQYIENLVDWLSQTLVLSLVVRESSARPQSKMEKWQCAAKRLSRSQVNRLMGNTQK